MILLGTCESAVCVRIEYQIESGFTIRNRIESRIESAIYRLKPRPQWATVLVVENGDYIVAKRATIIAVFGD